MNKKIIMFLVLLSNTVCFSLKADPFGGGGGSIFDDLFKNLDFDKLAKDMETILQEEKPAPSTPVYQPTTSTSPTSTTTTSTISSTPAAIVKTDRKSLFLDPIVVEQDKKDPRAKPRYKFPQIKSNAYTYYMDKLIKNLKSIEKKIDESRTFSPEFREEFLRYKKNIDDIVISESLISDRKFYRRAFFLPQFNGLREKIYTILPALESLEARVTALARKEEQQAHLASEQLFTFAKKPRIKLPPLVPIKPLTAGSRKGSAKIKNKDKQEEIKQTELEFFPTPKATTTPQEEPQQEAPHNPEVPVS